MNAKVPYENFESAKKFAKEAICTVDSEFEENFLKVLEFCFQYPEDVSGINGSPKLSGKWIEKKANAFVNQRYTNKPSTTLNIPDPLITTISQDYFDIENESLEELLVHHKIAMAAENVTGSLLEEYIATVMESLDWIRCSGTLITGTDFIKFPKVSGNKPVLLQIKNRSNSENSSSASIRKGTTIEKWYRLEAETGVTRWDEFPEADAKKLLSEAMFHEFAKERITEWKA